MIVRTICLTQTSFADTKKPANFQLCTFRRIENTIKRQCLNKKEKEITARYRLWEISQKHTLQKKAEEGLAMLREHMTVKMNKMYKRLAMNRNAMSRKVPEDVCKAVEEFYNRDDISKPTSGKKETITRKIEKKAQAVSM